MYVAYEMINGKAVVTTQVTSLDIVSPEHHDKFVEISSMPSVTNQVGKSIRYILDLEKNTVSVEYFERPLTPEEELEKLKEKQELVQQAIDELIFGGAL